MAGLFLIHFSSAVYAQPDSIDGFIHQVMQQRRIPGLQLAVVRNGEIVKLESYGLANIQDSVRLTDNTIFTINSITKAFTGVAIMQLVEAGKLQLEAPVSRYLDSLPASWRAVTVRQLLSHTSGIPNIMDNQNGGLLVPDNEAASWEQVQGLPMEFEAGESFSYCQTNYLLLGKIIGQLSGKHFVRFITENQLQKAGMPHTLDAGFGDDHDIIPQEARGYTYFRTGELTNVFEAFSPALRTTAGMHSTAEELAHWLIALSEGELLKAESSLSALWTPVKLNNGDTPGFSRLLNAYALGFPIASRYEHPAVTAIGGGRAALFLYPQDSLAIVVLTNLKGSIPETFIDEIAGFYIPEMKASNGFGYSPDVKRLWKELEKSGYKNVKERIRKLNTGGKGFSLPEGELNSWGYKLLRSGRIAAAIEIFKLNTSLYPESANTFDSLGEAFAVNGDKALAIKNYQRSLKLNPENTNAVEQLKKLRTN